MEKLRSGYLLKARADGRDVRLEFPLPRRKTEFQSSGGCMATLHYHRQGRHDYHNNNKVSMADRAPQAGI